MMDGNDRPAPAGSCGRATTGCVSVVRGRAIPLSHSPTLRSHPVPSAASPPYLVPHALTSQSGRVDLGLRAAHPPPGADASSSGHPHQKLRSNPDLATSPLPVLSQWCAAAGYGRPPGEACRGGPTHGEVGSSPPAWQASREVLRTQGAGLDIAVPLGRHAAWGPPRGEVGRNATPLGGRLARC